MCFCNQILCASKSLPPDIIKKIFIYFITYYIYIFFKTTRIISLTQLYKKYKLKLFIFLCIINHIYTMVLQQQQIREIGKERNLFPPFIVFWVNFNFCVRRERERAKMIYFYRFKNKGRMKKSYGYVVFLMAKTSKFFSSRPPIH